MNCKDFEFLSYEPDDQKKILGVATIRAWGKIILKYKLVLKKDGLGWFTAPAGSVRNGYDETGKDRYEEAFMIDSRYDCQVVDKLIRENVNPLAQFASGFQSITIDNAKLMPLQSDNSTKKAEDDFPF